MAKIISDLDDSIDFINTLLELDSTAPSEGDEDYTVWMNLLNVAVNLWEWEEGMLWKELYVQLSDAADGDKTTEADTYEYDCPTDFRFPNSSFVWLGTGTNKTAYKVIDITDLQLYENNKGNWCYFIVGATSTLNFNPNLTVEAGDTISYNYYKDATALTTGADTFDMADPMFAVYYALAELTKEEGNAEALNIAAQKLEAMKTKNVMPYPNQQATSLNPVGEGFGV
uniref:Uncharacterized protein n=1 Tax=viral metagenome TaxID=1070528 RepID=A0A6M3IGL7_9ZZZZ